MKKKVALFANGWSREFLQELGQGMRIVAKSSNIDIFAFINYTIHSETEEIRLSEFNIFKLPDLKDFDGAIVLTSTFNMQKEIDYVHSELIRAGIPAISLEYRLDGIDYYGIDDYSGMYELTKHIVNEHGAKDLLYIGGMEDHTGSNIRLQAARDAAALRRVEIPDSNVIYGYFSAAPATEFFEKWFEARNKKLPDAIICANDIMAIGICDWLADHGYKVPGDVIVTGFDCLKIAQENTPSITTVNREWLAMGTRTMEKLIQKMNGGDTNADEEITTSLVCGESCGCGSQYYYNRLKIQRKNDPKDKPIDGFTCDQHFRHMFNATKRCQSDEEFNDSLSQFFLKEGWLEGDDVLMAFHTDFFAIDQLSDLKMKGFPKEMNVICEIHDGKSSPLQKKKTKDILFSIAENNSEPGVYTFVPLRIDDVSIGFAILSRGFSIFQNDMLYLWCRHLGQYIEQVKSNVMINRLTEKLQNLSVTDGLTGVYNRAGCESVMYPALITNQENKGQSILMLADLDHLKYINDNFGHGHGDLAICLAVNAMQKALPNDFMIGRYGGDEFLIAGCTTEKMNLNSLVSAIEEQLKEEEKSHQLPYELSASIGAIQMRKGKELDIVGSIQDVDAKMFKVKKTHHKKQNL